MSMIKMRATKNLAVLLAVLMLFSVPVITNADSEGSIEIKMDLSYKYKRDDFRVIYKDASGKEYDVTSKAELEIEEIDTGVTTGGGDGIVRKAVATYDGMSDTVYEYTMWYKEGSKFSDLLGTGETVIEDGGEKVVRVPGHIDSVNDYLIKKADDKRPMDILNVKIQKNIYYGEQNDYVYFGNKKATNNVSREVNIVGCNSDNGDNSDYDMPIFDGNGENNKFLTIRISSADSGNDRRKVNIFNIQIQKYWNGLFYRSHDNGLIKGLILKDIYTPNFIGGAANASNKSVAGIEPVSAENNIFEDIEFYNLRGDGHMHAFYVYKNSDSNIFRNNFFLSSDVNTFKLRNGNDNNKIYGNYFYDALNAINKKSEGSNWGYICDAPDRVRVELKETTGYGNEFLGNHIRISDPNPENFSNIVSVYPDWDTNLKHKRFKFEDYETTKCKIADYTYNSGEDLEELIRINSDDNPNESSISSDPYKPVRSVIRHVDKDGNALRANDVIVTNGGETFTAQAKADLIGADGNPIYTSDYKAKLYDESGKEVTKDAEGNSIVDADGYIKTDGSGALLRSLNEDNQTFTFIYAPPATLTIDHLDADGKVLKTETKKMAIGDKYNLKRISDDFLKANSDYELSAAVDDKDKELTESDEKVTLSYKKKPSADTGDTIDYSSITDIKELEKHIPEQISSSAPAPAAAVENLLFKKAGDEDIRGSAYLPFKFQSRKQKTNAVTLKWSKVSGADRYVIYGNLCNTKSKKYKMVKIAAVKSSKKSYTVKKIEGKKLKKGTYYKFVIVAQKGDKALAASKTVHVATTGNKKKSNYTGVNVDKKTIAKAEKLKKGAPLSLKAKPSLKKGTKAQSHIKGKLRYESSNRIIATVSKNGKVKAKKKGTCYIYAYNQSGIAKKIKLKIR